METCFTASRILLGHTPADVWAFIRPAETSALLEPEVVRAFSVPGTGPGVGEQQIAIIGDGEHQEARLLTVVAEGEGWAETLSDEGVRIRSEVTPAGRGTRLALTAWPPEASGGGGQLTRVHLDDREHHLATYLDAYLDAVKAHLEDR
ncbi:hypothetical protein GCM10022215_22900 [Nocardioides fonticola]|uniref:SRPBCC family protein n=1 Tax=Nocardioides fonticola TaxID=450363 RepID=A0ABP7XJV8_9ACTN